MGWKGKNKEKGNKGKNHRNNAQDVIKHSIPDDGDCRFEVLFLTVAFSSLLGV